MADLGAIATEAATGRLISRTAVTPVAVPRAIIDSSRRDQPHVRGGRDDTEGNLQPPSFRLEGPGRVFLTRWPVSPGNRTVSIDVKYTPNEAPRPRLIVRANPEVGVVADVTGEAPSGTGWVTIGPLTVAVSQAGALEIFLEVQHPAVDGAAWWDNLQVT
jgi:hypothetical protein